MKDFASMLAIENLAKLPKIKGHTKIVLTDVKTKAQKIIEHDNTFQSSVLAKQLRSFGAANNNPFDNTTWAGQQLWRNLCGGIFLFRDAIDLTSGDVEFMPKTNQMVANCSYRVTNAGVPVELGSYNEIESATSGNDSLTFVYDWGTSQGNGTIGSVCLTSELGGYIGYGNTSGASASNKRSILSNQNSNVVSGSRFFYNGNRYTLQSIDLTNHKVVIGKSNDRITKASIFQGQNLEKTEYSFTGNVVNSSGTSMIARRIGGSKFAVAIGYASSVDISGSGGVLRFLVFDASTETLSVKEITNTSGQQIRGLNGEYSSAQYVQINLTQDSSGNSYLVANNNHLMKFDSDGVFVDDLGEVAATGAPFGKLTPDLIYVTPSYSTSTISVCNGTTVLPTNGTAYNQRCGQLDYLDELDALVVGTSGTSAIAPYKNPLFLATVNNLNSAIVKDNTQTMKVIYTLTEA